MSIADPAAACRSEVDTNFTWLGRPIRRMPGDILALQEIVWRVRPDLIVDTGMGQGGSLVLFASLLQLLGDNGLAIGIDAGIDAKARRELATHPLAHRMAVLQGCSTDADLAATVRLSAGNRRCVMVVLDGHQDEVRVRHELRLYAPLVTPGSYLVVCDAAIDGIEQQDLRFEADRDLEARLPPGDSQCSWLRRRS